MNELRHYCSARVGLECPLLASSHVARLNAMHACAPHDNRQNNLSLVICPLSSQAKYSLLAKEKTFASNLPETQPGFTYSNPAFDELEASMSGLDGAGRQRKLQQKMLLGGFVFASTDDADDSGHCQDYNCGALYTNVLKRGFNMSRINSDKILVVGMSGSIRASSHIANNTLQGWFQASGLSGKEVTYAVSTTQVRQAACLNLRMLFPSNLAQCFLPLHSLMLIANGNSLCM